MQKYKIPPQEILFVDDNINNIDAVKETKVHTLHFNEYTIDVQKHILDIETKK